MGIDVTTLALARKYTDKIAAGENTPSNTYSKEELDKKFDGIKEEVETSDIDVVRLVQTNGGELILFGGDSRT